MKTFSKCIRRVIGIWLCTSLGASLPHQARAQQDDYAECVALRYDRVRTDDELAATIAACSRVLNEPSSSSGQRAHAYYFRGLNHFLKATHLDTRPLVSAGEATQREVKLALDDLAASIAAAPSPSSEPFSLRATIYMSLQQYDEALPDLAEAIRADPTASVPHVQRALILERQDRFAEARAELDEAVRLDPRDQNAWINRAQLWARYGDFDQALADYGRAREVGGIQTWSALSGSARLAVVVGEPLRGYADYTRAADAAPLPMLAAQFHIRAGNLARDYLKDFDKAQQSYGRALAAMPTYADALIERGLAYERANRPEDASDSYRKAADIARDRPSERGFYDHALFRLEVLRSRLSRKAGELPPNINELTRPGFSKDQGRRVALVIGNAAYANVPPLMNSDRDAESIAGALSEAGFARVVVGTNLDRSQLEATLQRFSREAAGADWAVIYYAGHGIEVGGINYAIPVDATMDTLRDASAHAISIDQMIAAVGPARDLRMVVLDACRDDPFVQEAHHISARKASFGKSAGPDLDEFLARRKQLGGGLAGLTTAQLNTVAMFSTQPGQVTLDGEELNSPFTRSFLKNLPTPNLDLRSFFERVRDDVANGTQGRQRPAVNGQLREGERFFFYPPR